MKPFTANELTEIAKDKAKLREFLTDYGWRGLIAINIFVPRPYSYCVIIKCTYGEHFLCSGCPLHHVPCGPGPIEPVIKAYTDMLKTFGRYPNTKDRII
jgi:hypothetical protein